MRHRALTAGMLVASTIGLVTALGSTPVHAVDVADAAALKAALFTANTNGVDDVITLVGGATYPLSAIGCERFLIKGPGTVTITATGAGRAILDATGCPTRVMVISVGTAILEHLVITGGAPQGAEADGGGILNRDTLTIRDSVITGNHIAPGISGMSSAGSPGSAGQVGGFGGGIASYGTLTIESSTITDNSAGDGGSGGAGSCGTNAAPGADGLNGGGIAGNSGLDAIGLDPATPTTGGAGGNGFPGGHGGSAVGADGVTTQNGGTATGGAGGNGAIASAIGNGGNGAFGGSGTPGYDGGAGGRGGDGGGVYVTLDGSTTIVNSVISGNRAGNGGEGGIGGCGGNGADGGDGGRGADASGGGGGNATGGAGGCSNGAPSGRGGTAFGGKGGAGGTGGAGGNGMVGAVGSGGATGGTGGTGGRGGGLFQSGLGEVAITGSTVTDNHAGNGGRGGPGGTGGKGGAGGNGGNGGAANGGKGGDAAAGPNPANSCTPPNSNRIAGGGSGGNGGTGGKGGNGAPFAPNGLGGDGGTGGKGGDAGNVLADKILSITLSNISGGSAGLGGQGGAGGAAGAVGPSGAAGAGGSATGGAIGSSTGSSIPVLVSIGEDGTPGAGGLPGGVNTPNIAGQPGVAGVAGDGGGIEAADDTTIDRSSVTGNRARDGAGIRQSGAELHIRNSTISGNVSSGTVGGILVLGGSAELRNSTVTGNTSVLGASIYDVHDIRGSIIAGNSSSDGDCGGSAFTSSGDNIFGNASFCLITPGPRDQFGDAHHPLDPRLVPLADNGGGLPTHAVRSDSPALDAIPVASCGPTVDERGTPRPQHGACDVGAYEATAATAVDDAYKAVQNSPLIVAAASGVTANDVNHEQDVLAAAKLSDPAHGAVALAADGSFTYTPADGYRGPDSFAYNATDVTGASNPATVRIDVQPADIARASRFVPLAPTRIFDTRDGTGLVAAGFVAADTSIDVQIAGVAGVPADAVAVVMNVTGTESGGPGFVTVFPTGGTRPLASNLNFTAPQQTRPNLVTVKLGAAGKVTLYSNSGSHLLADVSGYYTASPAAASAGRVVPLTPSRVFDTRPGTDSAGPKGFVGAGETISVQVAGVGGVPSTGVAAVVLNATATEAAAAGFVTVFPTGSAQPLASVLNLVAAGDTAPNLVMVPLGDGGKVSLFSQSGTHLLADVTGYVTDATAPATTTGLFVPLEPARVFDTRDGTPAPGPKGFVAAGASIDTATAGTVGIAVDAAAVVLNVTGTDASAQGFVTGWPTGVPQPLASTLNLSEGDTRANAAILPIGSGGKISYFTQSGTNLLADIAGFYLG